MKENPNEFQELERRENHVVYSLQIAFDKGDYAAAHQLETELENVRRQIYEHWRGKSKKAVGDE